MAEQHKPGEIVKTSGIYKVVHEGDSKAAFEVTCVEGEHFPPRHDRQSMSLCTVRRIRTSTANSVAATRREARKKGPAASRWPEGILAVF